MYRRMIEEAREKGIASETSMWSNIINVEELLEDIKEEHPDKYWEFIRKTHESLYGCHYDEEFARYDVSDMFSTGRDGRRHEGQHWGIDEVRNVMSGKPMPKRSTDWDAYVALNVTWHDLNKVLGDEQIIEVAYHFFFADEDWPEDSSGKVWKYMMTSK